MAFIRKADIERMLAGNPYHRVLPTSRPKKAKESVTKSAKAKNGVSTARSALPLATKGTQECWHHSQDLSIPAKRGSGGLRAMLA